MKTYPYLFAMFAWPLFGGGGYTGVVYRANNPGSVVAVRQSCGHRHRHPTEAKRCAEALIREIEGGAG